jgi:hypothetical protein
MVFCSRGVSALVRSISFCACTGEFDHDASPVTRIRRAGQEARAFHPVEPVRHAAGGDEEFPAELAGGEHVRGSRQHEPDQDPVFALTEARVAERFGHAPAQIVLELLDPAHDPLDVRVDLGQGLHDAFDVLVDVVSHGPESLLAK